MKHLWWIAAWSAWSLSASANAPALLYMPQDELSSPEVDYYGMVPVVLSRSVSEPSEGTASQKSDDRMDHIPPSEE
jgi:hypothetical protein